MAEKGGALHRMSNRVLSLGDEITFKEDGDLKFDAATCDDSLLSELNRSTQVEAPNPCSNSPAKYLLFP